MIKNKDKWSALSMSERADLIKLYVNNGITSLDAIKKDYNSFAPGGPIEVDEYDYPADITPAVVEADYPREAEVWKRADASNADMTQRLRQGSSRVTIQDWEDPKKVATHKMMSAGNYVIGNVQNINGQLFDFTDPKHGFKDPDRAAIDSAIERGDYIKFDTEGDARYFAEHYKKHYNDFGDGGDTEGDNNNNSTTSTERKLTLEEFLQAKADSTRVAAHAKSLSRDEGIEIIYPLAEGRKVANQQLVDEYYDLNPEFIGPSLPLHLSIKPSYDQAVKELNNNCEYGLNCIGTATDNYPEDSREVSNNSFRENYEEKGFYIVPFEEKLPGDIVQQGGHSVIFDSYKREPHLLIKGAYGAEYPVYNYSNGSIGSANYRKQKRYPFDAPVVYRYKGTPKLIQQWTEEYNAQNKKFGGKLNIFNTNYRILSGEEDTESTLSGESPSKLRQNIRKAKVNAMRVIRQMQWNPLLESIKKVKQDTDASRNFARDYHENNYDDVAQDAFLFSKKEHENAFLNSGYIKGTPGDYGLVKKAVGDRNLPVYQTAKDDASREDLTVIGNISDIFFGKEKLTHAGSFPTAIYKDAEGNIYQKAWDLQDYGPDANDSEGAYSYYDKIKRAGATLLDKIGNPVVRTTGFQKLDDIGIKALLINTTDKKLWEELIATSAKSIAEEVMNSRILGAYEDYINTEASKKATHLDPNSERYIYDFENIKEKIRKNTTFDAFKFDIEKYYSPEILEKKYFIFK